MGLRQKGAIWGAMLAVLVSAQGDAAAQSDSIETGPLPALREEALSLVNEARREHGLNALEASETLQAAAQAHAEDMARDDYYAHVSPDGKGVQDRYLAHGGSRWRLVAENIATCKGCPVPPGEQRIESFQQGWMESPEHRKNILMPGLDTFGFGVAASGGRIYAVQDFAGPGMSPGLSEGEASKRLSPEQRVDEAVAAINRLRKEQGVDPLRASNALSSVAQRVVSGGSGEALEAQTIDPYQLLPGGPANWRQLTVQLAACGGCGAEPVAADIDYFAERWLKNERYRGNLLSADFTHLGFAMQADGEGRKEAALVLGAKR